MSVNLSLAISAIEQRLGVIGKKAESCEQHGGYVSVISSRLEKPSGCPECARERSEKARNQELEAERAAALVAKMEEKVGGALIPKRFQTRTFETYFAESEGQKKNLEKCRDYAANFEQNHKAGNSLLLLGKPGTGKTHLAAAIAIKVMEGRHTALYRTVSGILQLVKGSYGDSDYSESEAFASLVKPSLLIIDEVGATKPTEFEKAVLFEVINRRYEEMLPTIVISNLMPKELSDAMGERCIDRLREGGTAAVFDWPSMRAVKKDA